jgi:hypothetical protein
MTYFLLGLCLGYLLAKLPVRWWWECWQHERMIRRMK